MPSKKMTVKALALKRHFHHMVCSSWEQKWGTIARFKVIPNCFSSKGIFLATRKNPSPLIYSLKETTFLSRQKTTFR